MKTTPALLVLFGLAVVAAGMVLFCFDPAQYQFYPFCFFHRLTGLECPGCGALRALHQLSHGNIVAALHLNALLVFYLPLVMWLTVRFAARRVKRQPVVALFSPAWSWSFLVLAIGFSVLRNLPAFAWLAP